MAKILIVDDSALGRKLLTRILSKTGHEVVGEAENGEQGILEYGRVLPEIVAMDVDMPGIGGLEASRRILAEHPDAGIVIISSHEINDLKTEMGRYGLKYCIIKPVNEESVAKTFQKILDDCRSNPLRDSSSGRNENAPAVDKVGIKAAISHYSGLNPFAAVKTGEDGKVVVLEITKEDSSHFSEEDPVVIGYSADGTYVLSLCDITRNDAACRTLQAEVIETWPLEAEILYQTLPASLFVDFRIVRNRKRHPAIIKTFRTDEIVFKTAADLEEKEMISFDFFFKNKVLPIDGSISSGKQGGKKSEYVMKLSFRDYSLKQTYTSYLKELAGSLKSSIKTTCMQS